MGPPSQSASHIIQRTTENEVLMREQDKDAGFRNAFNWNWLERRILLKVRLPGREDVEVSIGEFIRKIPKPGIVICKICDDVIAYGTKGCISLENHLKTIKHISKYKLQLTNHKLFPERKSDSLTYGLAPNLVDKGIQRQEVIPVPVTMSERKAYMEAMILGVVAENSIPLSFVPKIKKLITALAMDTKALATLSSMGRTHASYKLTHGLAKSFHDKTLKNLKENYFSLNIDESGSTNNQKILTILVSYYCEEVKHIVIEHLASVSLVKVDSASLFKVLVEIFKDYDLNWNNLCSILMDSCAVMRGSKTGLEKRIRTQKCHHLLDIDGDVCHHCHNGTKRFCAPFENHLENLFYYLYNHFKWSTDLRKYLSDICDILYIKFTMPDRFLKHRWLSVYDVTMSTNRLYEAYFVFFFSCIPDKDKRDYKDLLNKIYVAKHVDEDGKSKIKVIQSEIKKKKLTKSGTKRRDSIVNLLIIQEQKTKLVLGFYSAALPIFKRYVCLFQSKNPLVHKLNDEQLRAFKAILNCFLKSESTNKLSPRALKDFEMEKCFLPLNEIHYGASTRKWMHEIEQRNPALIRDFKLKARKAYLDSSKYMQDKFPLNNPLLKSLSGIDPIVQHHEVSGRCLKRLPSLVTNVLSADEVEQYEEEILNYMSDSTLPNYAEPKRADDESDDESDNELDDQSKSPPKKTAPSDAPKVITRIDEWWHEVRETGRYNNLSKLVLATLSIFHGPLVESSFSSMGNIMDSKRYSLSIETFNSYLTVQYYFRAHDKNAVSMFTRINPQEDYVDRQICKNIKDSHSEFIKYQKRKKEEELESKPKKSKLQTKKAAIESMALEEKNARLAHEEKNRKRKARLEALSQSVSAKKKKRI